MGLVVVSYYNPSQLDQFDLSVNKDVEKKPENSKKPPNKMFAKHVMEVTVDRVFEQEKSSGEAEAAEGFY